jgi:hypothetical protein
LGLALETGPDAGPIWSDPGLTLFGETNGCLLVEVRPAHAPAFIDRFHSLQVGGRPVCTPMGAVTESPELSFVHSGEFLVHLPVSQLIDAFKRGGSTP